MAKRDQNGPIVYIDGENFLFRVANVLIRKGKVSSKDEIAAFDFRYLIETALSGDNLLIRYYGTRLKVIKQTPELEEKTIGIIAVKKQLASVLSKQGIEVINSGRLKLRDGDICQKCGGRDLHLQEKGVDVSIAADMVSESRKGRSLYLVSSDADLLPVLKKAKAAQAEVIYVGFSNNLTHALRQNADRVVVLHKKAILKAFERANSSN